MEKIDILNKRLGSVKRMFDELKSSGVSEEIMIIYIHHKTKISVKNIRKMLSCQEEFYNELVAKLAADAV